MYVSAHTSTNYRSIYSCPSFDDRDAPVDRLAHYCIPYITIVPVARLKLVSTQEQ